jgi:hypothetical protein
MAMDAGGVLSRNAFHLRAEAVRKYATFIDPLIEIHLATILSRNRPSDNPGTIQTVER